MIKNKIERIEFWEVSEAAWEYLIQAWPDLGSGPPDILRFNTDSDFYHALYFQWERVTASREARIDLDEIITKLDFDYSRTYEFVISWQKEKSAQEVVNDGRDE